MQQCAAGGFTNALQDPNTLIFTASKKNQFASVANNHYFNQNVIENEYYTNPSNGSFDTCHHGEFDFHVISSLTGKMPNGSTIYWNENLSDADENSDGIVSIAEAMDWEISHKDIQTEDPQSSDMSYIGLYTSLKYPTILHGNINHSYSVRGQIAVTKNAHLLSGNTITIKKGSELIFDGPWQFISDAGSTLIIEDSVKIYGSYTGNKIAINGNLQIGNHVSFLSDPGLSQAWDGLEINSPFFLLNLDKLVFEKAGLIINNGNVTITNTSFSNCAIHCYAATTTIDSSVIAHSQIVRSMPGVNPPYYTHRFFLKNSSLANTALALAADSICLLNNWISDYCQADLSFGSIDIENNRFISSPLAVSHPISSSKKIWIRNCTFEEAEEESAINLESYASFYIENDSIMNNDQTGILLFNAGDSPSDRHLIQNNYIAFNGVTDTTAAGIRVYHSYAEIRDNLLITGNPFGIQSLNNSSVQIKGNEKAEYVVETQQIAENATNQIYATANSFPYYMRYNAIFKSGNVHPLVYSTTANEQELDVSNNYWGEKFIPEEDLFPYELYLYEPVFELIEGDPDLKADEQLFFQAKAFADSGYYYEAKVTYRQLISNYSNSLYAASTLKELFSLENIQGGDFNSLKQYYLSDLTILNFPNLTKVSEYLANFCDIKLENYSNAIDWFEQILENHPSYEDSLFALIDLGYTYSLINNSGSKYAYIGKFPQYRPSSKEDLQAKRSYYTDLLFKEIAKHDDMRQNQNGLNSGNQVQIYPNPATGNIFFDFVTGPCRIRIRFFNTLGEEMISKEIRFNEKENSAVNLDVSSLKPGLFLCVIEQDGKVVTTEKILMTK